MPATVSYRILANGASQPKACADHRSTEYPRDLRVSIKLDRRYPRAADGSGRVGLFGDRQMRRRIWLSTADARSQRSLGDASANRFGTANTSRPPSFSTR